MAATLQTSRINLARILKDHQHKVQLCCLILGLLPALNIAIRWWRDELGVNPLDVLEKGTGKWALIYLLITLGVTPARRLFTQIMIWLRAAYGKRLSDWNTLIPLRRQFGLTAFFYALLHAGFYAWLDADWSFENMLADATEKPFMVVGLLALLLMTPLAATSTRYAMRLLGSNWRKLHRLVYVIAVAAVLHFIWLAKVGRTLPFVFAGILALLFAYRLLARWGFVFRRPRDDGMEVTPRPETDLRPQVTTRPEATARPEMTTGPETTPQLIEMRSTKLPGNRYTNRIQRNSVMAGDSFWAPVYSDALAITRPRPQIRWLFN